MMKLTLVLKSLLAFSILVMLFNNPLQAQDKIRCGTMEHLADQMEKDPTLKERRKQLEEELQAYINNPLRETNNDTVIIPIVFHVIHNGDAIGTNENIADVYIEAQLQQLNDDFRRMNSDADGTWSQAADTWIEFCLAQVDPNGNSTTGIVRHNISGGPWSPNNFDNNVKPTTIWDRDNYCNFWIADLSNDLLGYAQFPDPTEDADKDGVVCLYTSVGSIATPNPNGGVYDQGRTGTHEIGHWLNLRHIWGDGGNGCSNSDFCADTPNQESSTSGCPSGVQTDNCSSTSPGYMYQNYMDYSYDECMNIFTVDQRIRMQATLDGFRSSLKTASCGAVASQPVANFSPDSGTEIICGTSGTISFTDESSGIPDTWDWTFSGAGVSPLNSTVANPTVTVSASGTLTARLEASNSIGTDIHIGSIIIDLRPLSDPLCSEPACLEFNGSPYTTFNYADACFQTGCPSIEPNFEVWENESYALAGLIGGLDYTFEFCTGYSESTWDAIIAIGEYDPATNGAVPGSEIISVDDCTVTFTPPFSGDFIAVISGDGNCGGPLNQTNNGEPTFSCNTDCASQCGMVFKDAGGENFNYRNNENKTYVICPDNPSCEDIETAFTTFQLNGTVDALTAYNGDNTSAPLLGSFTGTNSPGTLTSTHTTGCLTFTFTSDGNGNSTGWEANVTCVEDGTCPVCPDDYAGANALSGTEDGTGGLNNDGDYETDGEIESTQVIVAGSVDYDSGTSIDLEGGFEVSQGAEIDVFIDGCNNGNGGNTLNGDEELQRRSVVKHASRPTNEKGVKKP